MPKTDRGLQYSLIPSLDDLAMYNDWIGFVRGNLGLFHTIFTASLSASFVDYVFLHESGVASDSLTSMLQQVTIISYFGYNLFELLALIPTRSEIQQANADLNLERSIT